MTRHMIVEIILLIFCAVTVIAAYACCVVAGRCSRMEESQKEQKETLKALYDNPDWIDNLKADFISTNKIRIMEEKKEGENA